MTQASDLGAIAGGQSGLLVRTAINANLQALATECEGATAPSPAYPFLRWRNDTAKLLYRRNAANSGWTIEQNYGATSDPGSGDDAADGYVRGSVWINAAGNRWFVCTDPTPGAAVWLQLAGLGALTSIDAGSGEGPVFTLDRNSPSPAANDLLGALVMLARSSAGVQRMVAKVAALLLDPANGAEDAALLLQTMAAGVLATRAMLGQGLVIGSGTDPGPGLVNAQSGYQLGGTALPIQKRYISAPTTITLNATMTFAHGLGVQPTLLQAKFRCVTPDLGFAVGDEVIVNNATSFAGATVGHSMWSDASNIYVRTPGNTASHVMVGPTSLSYCTAARWNLVITAWS